MERRRRLARVHAGVTPEERAIFHMHATPLAVVEWDLEFRAVAWNVAARTLFGYDADDMEHPDAYDDLLAAGGGTSAAQLRNAMLARQTSMKITERHRTRDGRTIVCEWHHTPLIDFSGKIVGIGSIAQDVTEAVRAAPPVAVSDSENIVDRLKRACDSVAGTPALVAVMIADVDGLRSINEGFGIRAGDRLLAEAATRLTLAVPDAHVIARLGGDEFVVVASVADRDAAAQLADRIVSSFADPFAFEQSTFVATASVGVALFPADGSGEALLAGASRARDTAKKQGRDCHAFFVRRAVATAEAVEQLYLETALRLAVARDELELYFQPQIDFANGRVYGAEALVRWHHPERGLIMPNVFIPVAERTGLIVPIGTWVLRNACEALDSWHAAGFPQLRVSVNVSGGELRPRIVDDIAAVLCAANVDPRDVELELTETVAMRTGDATTELLQKLKSYGVQISVDDFGIGYSSLAYLHRFPIDTLKIDRTFVVDCCTNRVNAAIVDAIIAMGHGLDVKVVAEGVESTEQANYLRSRGCQGAQGFHYGRPMRSDDFIQLMRSGPMFDI
jgi:diguanylate cyclase (GGDEF)-like protein/PAS domain S-box-containing protein